jgi:cytochrome c551/c552
MSSLADRMCVRRLAGGLLAVFAFAAVPMSVAAQGSTSGPRFNFGRAPTAAEIAAWDVDVRPDGHGLRKGRGTVARGQEVYDQQCAACHGTFGESNAYLVLAGGVEPGDLKTGRASRLRDPEVPRTVGTKLNAATTLYDYIYRSMPWTNPMSLSVDDTYAVTAYVLHLNDILPADGALDEKSILTVPMPNRNGMTRNHGMASVKGKPDVQGSLCMTNCTQAVKVTSELPPFARNAHGNLAEQFRPIGGKGAIDTTRYENKPAAAPAAVATAAAAAPAAGAGAKAQQLLAKNGCVACHHPSNRVVGPSFAEIAGKQAARSDAKAYLVGKIRQGGAGVWGAIPMPPQSISEAEASELAAWIISGAKP